MTSSGESSVSYLCPQCGKNLTANAEDAGQRRECPHCGKVVKVPGTTARAKPKSSHSSPSDGIANIPLVCPLCGTRMYATKKQIGQTMVCPDCLESVVVPDRRPPKPPTQRPVADPDAPGGTTATGRTNTGEKNTGQKNTGQEDAAADKDEITLSDPVELPRHRSVTGALADLIDQHVDTHQDESTDQTTPSAPTPPRPREFAIKCPVCDTMLQATEEEIGTQKECPDCFSPLQVTRPRAKHRRVNEVVESDYDNGEFVLGAPVDLDVYRPTDADTAPRTVGEEALRNARLAQAERERGTPDMPRSPLLTGVFDFLPDGATITRISVTGALIGVTIILALLVVRLALGDASMQFLSIALAFLTLFLTMVTVSYTSVSLLNVLQESAEGAQRIESWPENQFVDWLAESFPLIMAVLFAAGPGILLGLITQIGGAGWLFVGFSLYVCFPVVQLSILETASLTNPLSKPILDSLSDDFLHWCTFYLITMFMALVVGFAMSCIRTNYNLVVFIPVGFFLAFAGFLYFRLLGRLAWTCQMRPLLEKNPASKQKKKTRRKTKRARDETPNDS